MLETTELISLGFTETDASTYVALLELGSGTVTTITHRADITRTLGYHSLDRLVEFGLIEQKNNSNPIQFHVKHPKFILNYLSKEKSLWENRITSAHELLPKLESLYTMLEHPFLSNRVGKEAVLDLYRTLYTNNNSILSLFNPSTLDQNTILDFCKIKSESSAKENTCCIFDTLENRQAVSQLSPVPQFHWIQTSKVHTDVYKSIETILSGDTMYTISNKDGELYADSITHQGTVSGMYTLMYTLINEENLVSHETV